MKQLILRSIAAACVLAGASAAHADDIDFTGFAHGSQSVNFSLASPNAVKTGAVSAGGFATTLNGGASFVSYCIDLYETINFGDAAYSGYTRNDAHVFTNAAAYGNLGRLYATAGIVDSAVEEAAFQIAVWEIAYEDSGTPYDLLAGAARFSGGTADTSGALTLASSWLGVLNGTAFPGVGIYESAGHQDIVMAPVPEESTVVLMLSGLLGLGALARRRKAHAERVAAAA